MRWILLDVLIVLAALVGLGLVVLSLWRKVKDLAREVARAGETIGAVTAELEQLQAVAAERTAPGPSTAATPPARTRRR